MEVDALLLSPSSICFRLGKTYENLRQPGLRLVDGEGPALTVMMRRSIRKDRAS